MFIVYTPKRVVPRIPISDALITNFRQNESPLERKSVSRYIEICFRPTRNSF